ncbi:hypothetical protein J8L98_02280 [Pseudoalteromonas sp. MMG013]|uniref:hypothetical protein n=1 Tax=Pseudoalteromonas sp. MMG013 TaxID=2822687 RepID=UPI001B3947FD|nr:hypothetical protein [Pseudoalteromonas sp. MMG013]MBQ4860520.1 hypothetical protein [Pseudoalteromonas sp. MMG013]
MPTLEQSVAQLQQTNAELVSASSELTNEVASKISGINARVSSAIQQLTYSVTHQFDAHIVREFHISDAHSDDSETNNIRTITEALRRTPATGICIVRCSGNVSIDNAIYVTNKSLHIIFSNNIDSLIQNTETAGFRQSGRSEILIVKGRIITAMGTGTDVSASFFKNHNMTTPTLMIYESDVELGDCNIATLGHSANALISFSVSRTTLKRRVGSTRNALLLHIATGCAQISADTITNETGTPFVALFGGILSATNSAPYNVISNIKFKQETSA